MPASRSAMVQAMVMATYTSHKFRLLCYCDFDRFIQKELKEKVWYPSIDNDDDGTLDILQDNTDDVALPTIDGTETVGDTSGVDT